MDGNNSLLVGNCFSEILALFQRLLGLSPIKNKRLNNFLCCFSALFPSCIATPQQIKVRLAISKITAEVTLEHILIID